MYQARETEAFLHNHGSMTEVRLHHKIAWEDTPLLYQEILQLERLNQETEAEAMSPHIEVIETCIWIVTMNRMEVRDT